MARATSTLLRMAWSHFIMTSVADLFNSRKTTESSRRRKLSAWDIVHTHRVNIDDYLFICICHIHYNLWSTFPIYCRQCKGGAIIMRNMRSHMHIIWANALINSHHGLHIWNMTYMVIVCISYVLLNVCVTTSFICICFIFILWDKIV